MSFHAIDSARGIFPLLCVEIDVTNPPTNPTRVWTDITADIRSLNYTRSGRNDELQQTQPGTLNVVLSNKSAKYDPSNAGGIGIKRRQWIRVRGAWPGWSQQILALGPSLYWRLGSSSVLDLSGNGRNGTPGSGVTFGEPGALAGDPTTSALFNNTSSTYVSSTYQPFVSGSSRTFMGWANRSGSGDIDVLFGGANGTGGTATLLFIDAGSTSMAFAATEPAQVGWTNAWPGNGQWVHWALTYNDTTEIAELFINGVSQGQRTTTAGYPGNGAFDLGVYAASGLPWDGYMQDVAVFESILTASQIQAIYEGGAIYPRWQGIVSSIDQSWPSAGADAISTITAADALKIANLYDLYGAIFPSETSDQRVYAVCSLLGISDNLLDTGISTLVAASATTFGIGSAASMHLSDVETTENGLVYADENGEIAFQSRHYRATHETTPLDTIGDAAGQIPYTEASHVVQDDAYITSVAYVTPTNADGSSGTVQTATNSSSESEYFTSSPSQMQRTILSSSVDEASDCAQYLVNRYGDPAPRIPAVELVLDKATSKWPTVLGAGNSSRFTFVRDASAEFSEDVYVERVSEKIAPNAMWRTTFQLSPADDSAWWVLQDSVVGVLGTTTRAAY